MINEDPTHRLCPQREKVRLPLVADLSLINQFQKCFVHEGRRLARVRGVLRRLQPRETCPAGRAPRPREDSMSVARVLQKRSRSEVISRESKFEPFNIINLHSAK